MSHKQVIKLKPADLNQAIVRGLSRAAWQAKEKKIITEKVHLNPKFKPERHRKRFEDLNQ